MTAHGEQAWGGPGGRETWIALRESGGDYLRLIDRLTPRHGDLFRLRLGPVPLYVAAGPEPVAEILKAPRDVFRKNPWITREMRTLGPESLAVLDGERWKRHRVGLSGPFRPARLADHEPALHAALADWRAAWRSRGAHPARVEVDAADFTFEVFTRMLLGRPAPGLADRVREALETEIDCLTRRLTSPLPLPRWLPTPNHRRLGRAQRALDASIRELIGCVERGETDGAAAGWLEGYLRDERDAVAARSALRDQAMTLLTAGHQTASFGVAYCLAKAAELPEAAARIRAEADAVLAGRPPTLADLEAMPFVAAFVRETLRLHPVLPVVLRRTAAPWTVLGRTIPSGANVAISLWSAQRDPAHWPEPTRFDPERFLGDAPKGRHPGAFVPFALGARSCLAGDFAFFELCAATADLVQHFELEPEPDWKLAVAPRLALAPVDGVRLRVRPRVRTGEAIP